MIAQARQQKNSLNRPEWREQKESHDMSKNENKSAAVAWTSVQAYALSVICLLVGLAGGGSVRGSQGSSAAIERASPAPAMTDTSAPPTPEQIKHMADKQAEPLLAQLKSDPQNGDIYYDT